MDIQKIYREADQEQLFSHFDKLSDAEKSELIQNLAEVAETYKPNELSAQAQKALQLPSSVSDQTSIKALPPTCYHSIINNLTLEEECKKLGSEAIEKGEVAVILMAGGQGTRLGSSKPKGCYDIGLPSHKSLFEIQSDKIFRLQKMSSKPVQIPWYIMTSKATRSMTEEHFVENSYFGLDKSQIIFFNQGTLPAFDPSGKHLLLQSKTKLVESPNGNGGLYRSIKDNDLIGDFEKRGIKHVYMYCVDNVLSKVADPVFIGFAIKYGFQLATKAVRKRDASESVGLIATKDDKPCVIEYSEISKELSEMTDETGLLKLRAANIVNHYYAVDLLKEQLDNWCDNMPYHIAKKKIPYYDNVNDEYVKPTEPNGIKLEQFIFDVFSTVSLSKFGCLEVDREIEFSPLKNASGTANDNPETSREAYLKLGTTRLRAAGARISDDAYVEVSGKLSYSGENLEQYKGVVFDQNVQILE